MIKGEQNEFFYKWEAAIENKDLDRMVELMHPECTVVLHSTGKVIRRDEWKETFGKLISSDKFKRDKTDVSMRMMTLWFLIHLLRSRMAQPMQ